MAYASPLDLPVTNFSSGRPRCISRIAVEVSAIRLSRTFSLCMRRGQTDVACCMSAAAVVVVSLAIILAIAMVIAAMFVARRIDRDEPGPTRYDPDLFRGSNWYG